MQIGRKMPPLNALRAFEAAGRHLSFTRAADELCVTPAAISQQVKTLEAYLGLKLLRRKGRGLELTEIGRSCLPEVHEGFDRLSASMERLAQRDAGELLTVSVSPCFGNIWLAPRLPRFQAMYPDIDVRVLAIIHQLAAGRDNSDIAVRYIPGPFPASTVEALMPERVFPVCSPQLAEGKPPLRSPQDLRHHRLLHDETTRAIEGFPDWRRWLAAAGVTGVDAQRGSRLTLSSMVLQAAIRSEGVALARSVLVEDDLASGRLVRPFDFEFPQSFGYYLVAAEADQKQKKIRAFWDWIMNEARA